MTLQTVPKVVLFDLGNTLEDHGSPVTGATETLRAIQGLRGNDGQAPIMALVSDFTMPASRSQIPAIRKQYFAILDRLGIRAFFEPVSKTVTLSTEVGVTKPDRRIFEAALKKIGSKLQFKDAIFITEEPVHIAAARLLGMKAVHFKGPGQLSGDIERLIDLVPIVRTFLGATP